MATANTRRWYPTGIGGLETFRLDPNARGQLITELRTKDFRRSIPEEFFAALETAIAQFQSDQKLAQSNKPAQVRRNLQKAIKAVTASVESVNNLDENSRYLVQQVDPKGIRAVYDPIRQALQVLVKAFNLSKEYPMRGKLPQRDRLWLAVNVRYAIADHLPGVSPSTTKDGLFESVLTIILEAATRDKVSSVHDLVCRAMKSERRRHPDGLVTYHPPKDE